MLDCFFIVDIVLGLSAAAIAAVLYSTGRMGRFMWYLFWLGAALGLSWELGCNIQMALSPDAPLARFLRPLPVHAGVIVAVHALWDGALFLAGAALVKKLCAAPHFARFRWTELAVLLAWGQAQELAVELAATSGGAWEWLPYPWNPALFIFNGYHITLLPHLIWLTAVLVFYPLALAMRKRIQE
ncbi:MAG: hypothetical protein MUC76_06985 [Spirochaetes bacterium]|jgi:hypothetical protein|nr:hypothetical protein [Spirochaetota bacterium]